MTESPDEADGGMVEGTESANPSEAIRKLAAGKPEAIESFLAMGVGSLGNPLHQKMNEAHISTVLELAVKHDANEFELAKRRQDIEASGRWFKLAVFLVIAALVVFVIALFRDNQAVLPSLITGLVAFGGGFGAGWGMGKHAN